MDEFRSAEPARLGRRGQFDLKNGKFIGVSCMAITGPHTGRHTCTENFGLRNMALTAPTNESKTLPCFAPPAASSPLLDDYSQVRAASHTRLQ